MPVVAKRYKVRFEESDLRFSEAYPTDLEGVLPLPEFDAVVRKINEEMTKEIRATNDNVRKWAITSISLCIVAIGLFLTPVLFVKTKRQKKELKRFWEELRTYLGEINRKTFLKRSLEWKLVEDKKKLKGRDVVNPMFAYRIEIIHRVTKMKPTKQSEGQSMSAIAAKSAASSASRESTSPSSSERSSIIINAVSTPTKHDEEDISDEEDDLQGEEIILEDGGFQDDIIIEEEDEEDYDDDVGNLASISSVGAGSYSRGSLILTPAAIAVAQSQGRIRDSLISDRSQGSSETAPPGGEPASTEEVEGISELPGRRRKKRSSRVRFTGLFDDEDEEDLPMSNDKDK